MRSAGGIQIVLLFTIEDAVKGTLTHTRQYYLRLLVGGRETDRSSAIHSQATEPGIGFWFATRSFLMS